MLPTDMPSGPASTSRRKTERDNNRKEAAVAREEVAKLRGQVEVLQTQARELMRALSAFGAGEGEGRPATPPGKGKTR